MPLIIAYVYVFPFDCAEKVGAIRSNRNGTPCRSTQFRRKFAFANVPTSLFFFFAWFLILIFPKLIFVRLLLFAVKFYSPGNRASRCFFLAFIVIRIGLHFAVCMQRI